jgi:ssDNA-binding Zn-finger/Zn-ribbon topoisomerase 1
VIRFDCPQCGTTLKAPLEKAGKPMVCPRCQELCRAPGGAAWPSANKDEGRSAPSVRSSGQAILDAEQTTGLLSGMNHKVRCAAAVVAGVGVVSLLLLVLPSVVAVRPDVGEAASTWAMILGPGSVVLLLVLLLGQATGCPECGKWWARTKRETEFVECDVFDRKGVPFVRSMYRTTYQCDSCRHRWSVVSTDEDPKSVRQRRQQQS